RSRPLVGGLIAAAALAASWRATAGRADESATSDDSALVSLGRRLFLDPTVSRSGRRACASCHDPEHGWSDAKQLSDDDAGPTRRHSRSIADMAGTGFHSDGEFAATRDIVVARVGDPSDAGSAEKARGKLRDAAADAHGFE